MMQHSLPAIVEDAQIREAEAKRLAYEVTMFEAQDVQQAIARYGQFIDLGQMPPATTMKDFCLAVRDFPAYQETIEPLRDYRFRLDDFDDKFALAVFRLVTGFEVRS